MTTDTHLARMKDTVARWQTYRDRGIIPNEGWKAAPEGAGCALGDVAYHAARTDEAYLGHGLSDQGREYAAYWWLTGLDPDEQVPCYCDKPDCVGDAGYYMPVVNDMDRRWPIEELQRLIDWEEAGRAYDQTVVEGNVEFFAAHLSAEEAEELANV